MGAPAGRGRGRHPLRGRRGAAPADPRLVGAGPRARVQAAHRAAGRGARRRCAGPWSTRELARQGSTRCRMAGAALVVAFLEPSGLAAAGRRGGPDPGRGRPRRSRRPAVRSPRSWRSSCGARATPVGVVTRAPGPGRRPPSAGAGSSLAGRSDAARDRLASRLLTAARAGESGQALPLVLGLALVTILAGLVLALLGVAATGGARLQRAADLAAVSAARSMRDDHHRLFVPARTSEGGPNPAHLSEREYRARARAAAERALPRERRGRRGQPRLVSRAVDSRRPASASRSSGRDRDRRAARGGRRDTRRGGRRGVPARRAGGARRRDRDGRRLLGPPRLPAGQADAPGRRGRVRPSRRGGASDGHALVITSAFRSDAEQAALFAANPDPRWVAPPGTSLHRCATELDLGPASAYAWLAANARRFGFLAPLLVGGVALRVRGGPAALLGRGEPRRQRRALGRSVGGSRTAVVRSRPVSRRRSPAPPRAGTSRLGCSPRS